MSTAAIKVVTLSLEEHERLLERAAERGAARALANVRPVGDTTVSIRKCGLPDATRKKATRAGKLPTFRVGRELHVRVADVTAFIEAGRVERDRSSPELARAMRGAR